jgi:hypothetical protein
LISSFHNLYSVCNLPQKKLLFSLVARVLSQDHSRSGNLLNFESHHSNPLQLYWDLSFTFSVYWMWHFQGFSLIKLIFPFCFHCFKNFLK